MVGLEVRLLNWRILTGHASQGDVPPDTPSDGTIEHSTKLEIWGCVKNKDGHCSIAHDF